MIRKKTSRRVKPRPDPQIRRDAKAARKAAEHERTYGTPERQAWMRALRCAGCRGTPCEIHHVRTGGMGRKCDASGTVPLCRDCHRRLHDGGKRAFERKRGVTLAVIAELLHEEYGKLARPSLGF